MAIYTDLALEMAETLGTPSGIDGVSMDITMKPVPGGAVKVTWIRVRDGNGARVMGRPIGNYITAECESMKVPDVEAHEGLIRVLVDILAGLEPVKSAKSVLVAGLGNWHVTPDALGPRVASKTLVTRHMDGTLPENLKKAVRPVAVISPGVMGITGIETGEIIQGVVERSKPSLVIAIDALAARRVSRVNATIQIADTGLTPGSGMGNIRMPLSEETLGTPVIAIGVPTVVDAATLVNDTMDIMLEDMTTSVPQGSEFYKTLKELGDEDKYPLIKRALDPYMGNMFVTPKEVDAVIDRLSNIIANTINIALHPGITKEDINRYMY
ncbi:MAG: GPR endopeptidase [Clostridiales bacterium]|jgi:spore protease|nr:GPR endopeptidase [Clostridiales bacterium]